MIKIVRTVQNRRNRISKSRFRLFLMILLNLTILIKNSSVLFIVQIPSKIVIRFIKLLMKVMSVGFALIRRVRLRVPLLTRSVMILLLF